MSNGGKPPAAHSPSALAADRVETMSPVGSPAHPVTESGAPPAPPRSPSASAFAEALALFGIAAVEAAALAHILAKPAPAVLDIAATHLAALGALGLLLALSWRRGGDTTYPLLALISATVLGPIGPLGAAALRLGALHRHEPSPLIAAWYERISMSTAVDPETRLCEDVRVGRTLDLGTTKPQPFPSLMQAGPLAARQFILGLIARQFHPSYLETLKIALKSPEPSIRVQAAAVATHIGADLRQRFEERIATVDQASRDPIASLDLLGEIENFLASGLLDEAERKRAVDLAGHLGDSLAEALDIAPIRLPFASDPVRAAELDIILETFLLARQRYADLRRHRTDRRIQRRHPTARTRRLATPASLRESAP